MPDILDFMPWPWPSLFGGGRGKPRLVRLPDSARPRHGDWFGGTGTGKSRHFDGLFIFDVIRRLMDFSSRGAGLIDVHGDLFVDVRNRLALISLDFPQLYDLLYIVDPTNMRWFVKYNPLELQPGEFPEDRAGIMADVVTTMYRDNPTIVNRMRWLSYHAFLTLIYADLSLLQFPKLLRDQDFRNKLVKQINHPELNGYWLQEFPRSHKEAISWAESSLDRIGPFVTDPRVKNILKGPSTINFREIMDKGAFVLINAPKGILGEGKAYLFCAFLLAEIQNAAMSRINLSSSERKPFSLLCDEFQNYTTETIVDIVKESRKMGLELMLATQEVRGRPEDEALLRSVRKVAGNTFAFRLDREDAEILVKDLFTPEIDQLKIIVDGKPYYRSLGEVWEYEIRKLTELPDRMLYWKRRGQPGSRYLETITISDLKDMPNYHLLPEARRRQDLAAYKLAALTKTDKPQLKRLPKPRQDRPPTSEKTDSLWTE